MKRQLKVCVGSDGITTACSQLLSCR